MSDQNEDIFHVQAYTSPETSSYDDDANTYDYVTFDPFKSNKTIENNEVSTWMTEIVFFLFHAIQGILILSMYSIPAAAWAKCKTGESKALQFFLYLHDWQTITCHH